MDSFTSFKITTNDEDCLTLFSEILESYGCEHETIDNSIVCQESYELVSIDDFLSLIEELKEHDEFDFEISGTIDSNGNEFIDFEITNYNGDLKVNNSAWYNDLDDEEEEY